MPIEARLPITKQEFRITSEKDTNVEAGQVDIWKRSNGKLESAIIYSDFERKAIQMPDYMADAVMHVLADALGYSVVKIEGDE